MWCWRRLLRVPWTARRSNQSILKEISPGISLERMMLKLKVLWPSLAKSWLIGKDSDAGRDWGQEEKGTTEYEMSGWHYQLDGHEFWWTPGVGDGQGGLVHCNSWGCKESDTTEWLNWTEWKTRRQLRKDIIIIIIKIYHGKSLQTHIYYIHVHVTFFWLFIQILKFQMNFWLIYSLLFFDL